MSVPREKCAHGAVMVSVDGGAHSPTSLSLSLSLYERDRLLALVLVATASC